MPRTRPEVNPKISVPKKKLGAKTVGFVGASLARGKYGFDLGRSRGLLGIFHGGRRTKDVGEVGKMMNSVLFQYIR